MEHTFGDIIGTSLASRILLTLLRHRLVEVTDIAGSSDIPLPQNCIWVNACVEATTGVSLRLQKKPFTLRYTWSWTKLTYNGVCNQHEGEASQLLNTLGDLSYAIAFQLNSDFDCLRRFWEPNLGIVSLPVDVFKPVSSCSDDAEAWSEVFSPCDAYPRLDLVHNASQSSFERSAKGTAPPHDPDSRLKDCLEDMLSHKFVLSDYPLPPQSQFKKLDPSRLNWASITSTGEVLGEEDGY